MKKLALWKNHQQAKDQLRTAEAGHSLSKFVCQNMGKGLPGRCHSPLIKNLLTKGE